MMPRLRSAKKRKGVQRCGKRGHSGIEPKEKMLKEREMILEANRNAKKVQGGNK
jgi:hypothetical protein